MSEHFRGCHSQEAEAPEPPEGSQPQDTEDCWHCGTPAPRGCNSNCRNGAD